MIRLDLRTALPKIRAAHKAGELRQGGSYIGPCALGAAMTPEEREYLAARGFNTIRIGRLISDGIVEVPAEQAADVEGLQQTFDFFTGDWDFDRTLAALEAKYV